MKTYRFMTLLALVLFLFPHLVNAQKKEISKVKADIEDVLNSKMAIYEITGNDTKEALGSNKKIVVLDDRIEMTFKKGVKTVNLSDKLTYEKGSNYLTLGTFEFIDLKKGYAKELKTRDFAGELTADLSFLQSQLNDKLYITELALFEPIAAQYRALKVKPQVTERLRELIVQANSCNQQKMYDKAIDYYNKAIELDKTAYPAAYLNLALLSAQIQKYNTAIFNMKKYLLLDPESSDARSAQDKIYEWKIFVNQ